MTPNAATHSGEVYIVELVTRARDIARAVWINRRILFRSIAVALLLGLTVALTSRPEYTASMKILPYRNAANTGGLSSLAGLAGIRLPVAGVDQTITADLYPVVARTLDFRLLIAETALRFDEAAEPVTMVTYFRQNRSAKEKLSELASRMRASLASALMGAQTADSVEVIGASGTPLRTYPKAYLAIVDQLDDRLSVSIEKKTSIITITGRMPARYAAADLVKASSVSLMRRIIEYEAKKAEEQLRFIEAQYTQSLARYENAQKDVALFADRNRVLVGATAQLERDRLQRQADLEFQIYQQLSMERERARIQKIQDTPVFTVLEDVVVPNQRTSPRRTAIVVFSIFAGLVVGLLVILSSALMAPPEKRVEMRAT